MLTHSLKKLITSKQFSQLVQKSVGIIGVPFCKGQGKHGVEDTPEMLRKAGLIDILRDRLYVNDYGNLQYKQLANAPLLDNMKNYSEFLGCSIALIEKVQSILNENDMYLAIGGDHSIGFGSVAGHLISNPNTSLIWIDAHADINLNVTSASGNIHGMPVAFLMKELRKFWTKLNIEKIAPNCLPAKELVYIGLRDIDPQEAYILNKLGITFYAMNAVDKFGIPKIIEMSLDAISPTNKLHISFDIDAVDVSFAPSTGTAVPGGLTLRESLYIMEALSETNRVQGVDMAEINPRIGTEADSDLTLSVGTEIIKSVCGYKRSGNLDNVHKGFVEF